MELPQWSHHNGFSMCKNNLQRFRCLMHLQNQKFIVILPRENFQFVPDNDARNVSTKSHLLIAREVSPIPIIVRWMLVLNVDGRWPKLNNMKYVQHRTGQEMHREVRATLTSVNKLS
jgi:hypothetical protein